MPIELEQPRAAGTPVLKRRTIGERYVGGIIRFDQRDLLKDGQPVLKDNGRPRRELVVHLYTRESTMQAGLGDQLDTPGEGDIVRLILKGGGFKDWIDAQRDFANTAGRGLQVGDLALVTTTHVVRYQSTGSHAEIGQITTPEDLERYYRESQAYRDRRESLGFRGEMRLRPAKPDEQAFVVACEAAYHDLDQATRIPLDNPDPFPTQPAGQEGPPPAPAPAAGGGEFF